MRATVTGATSGTRRRPWRRPADALRSRCGAGLGPVMRSHPATAPPRGFACSWASVVLGVPAGIPRHLLGEVRGCPCKLCTAAAGEVRTR